MARLPTTAYLTGGATAVLLGWRESTIDVDLKFVPDRGDLLSAIPALKEELELNVELASPDDFIPVQPGWQDRSPWEGKEGLLTVRHFDLVAQALSKIERGHERDRQDVAAMLERGLIEPAAVWAAFDAISPELYRYPAVEPARFRRSVAELIGPPAGEATPWG
ncbi:MAG: DUF6036 family nucleotidyltransferase [Acidimicrobiales bacterium]